MKELIKAYLDSNKSEPLLLPHGSVRALLIISLVVIAGIILLEGKVLPEWFTVLLTNGLNTYFLTRKPKQKDEKPEEPSNQS